MVIGIDIEIDAGPGGGGGGAPETDFFTPSPAQTVFILSGSPADPAETTMRVNQLTYAEGNPTPGYFVVSGNTLTWLSQFPLDPDDEVEVVFFP